MDNSSINPVTEAEVRNIAERLVTSFVNLSEQSKELADLKARFYNVELRLNSLLESNERMKAQIDTLVSERDQARASAAENLELARTYEQERDVARQEKQEVQAKLDRLLEVQERRQEDYRLLYDNYSKSLREGSQARNERDQAIRDGDALKSELAKSQTEARNALVKLDRVTKALQDVAEVRAEASEEAKADITRVADPMTNWPNADKPLLSSQDKPAEVTEQPRYPNW